MWGCGVHIENHGAGSNDQRLEELRGGKGVRTGN